MLIEVMSMRIMNNEKKIQDAEKEAGGDEKLIGASLSEPHTRELGGEISVILYACLYISVGLRARIRGKMFAWYVRITADSKSTSRRFDTGK